MSRLLGVFFLVGSYGAQPDLCQVLCKTDGPSVCTGGSWNKNGYCHGYLFRGPPTNNDYCYHTVATAHTCPAKGTPVKVSDVPRLLARSAAPAAGPPVTTTTTTTEEPASTTTTLTATTSTTTTTTTTTHMVRVVHPVDERSRDARLAALQRIIRADNLRRTVLFNQVRRKYAFSDSYVTILNAPLESIRSGTITASLRREAFYGPAAQREFMSAVTAHLFNPEFGLFKLTEEAPHYAYINPEAAARQPDHVLMFTAVGRFLGLALARNEALGVTLPAAFWASLIGEPLELPDIKNDEPILFRSLEYLLSASEDELVDMPLMIDGVTFEPTVDNRQDLVNRKVNSLIDPAVRPLLGFIRQGLDEVIGVEIIRSLLSAAELREVFVGSTFIDIADLQANSNQHFRDPLTEQWFWNVLNSFDQEMRKKFLKFATNLDNLPVGGFSQIKPKIFISVGLGLPSNRLPIVHHCMNSMAIPLYTSEDILREKLVQAILGSTWGS